MHQHGLVWASVCYSVSNTGITLLNKALFSQREFDFPWFTLAAQNIIAILLVIFARVVVGTQHRIKVKRQRGRDVSGLVHDIPLPGSASVVVSDPEMQAAISQFLHHPWHNWINISLCRQIAVPIVFFVLFIFSNAQSLKYLSLPVLTCFKSLAPIFTTLIERTVFGDIFGTDVYVSMLLVVLSTIVTFAYDIEFSPWGYIWALLNVSANVAYLVSLRVCLSDDFSSFEKAFHSNLLSLVAIVPLSFISGELPGAFSALANETASYKLGFFFSGAMTLALVTSSFWVLSSSNGATLSFLGGLNKIPVVFLGYFLFGAHVSMQGWIGIGLGILAGIFFIQKKTLHKIRRSPAPVRMGLMGFSFTHSPKISMHATEMDMEALQPSPKNIHMNGVISHIHHSKDGSLKLEPSLHESQIRPGSV
ncbi:GDP-mannose transporter [Porphyridium purpureum]|uniref:GDP-mannose transporter n=1 Tax=Porphyridium purpureum TaxID=35688 RepID=A0A5J4ZAZ3_PORPP|nr:GDP-mannose transporter [Porphyridium purpureum]|eukprot:POR6111..scf295_1